MNILNFHSNHYKYVSIPYGMAMLSNKKYAIRTPPSAMVA